jgi:DNA repair exonuclease SbcCD ATPase subunit
MIIFTHVKYQNFLASGNAPISIPLNAHSATLIVGHNGTGKSTLSEAICFALFGRPMRNITKPKLVNSINNRDCLVELDFTTNSSSYKIRRGIKPNVFEIYEGGNLIPAPASVLDYQTMLEDHILKLNYKSFMQVVVLGSASYVPFMRLTGASRREIIEDLLDIEVFGAMNVLTKEDLTGLKVATDKGQTEIALVSKQVEMAQSYTDHLEDQRAEQLAKIDATLQSVQTTVAALEAERQTHAAALIPYAAIQTAYDTAHTKQVEYEKMLTKIAAQDKKARKERTFYEEHDHCPTCEQGIDETFKAGRYEVLAKTEADAAKALAQCQALITKYRAQVDTAQAELDKADSIQKQYDAITAKLPVHQARIKELQAERVKIAAAVPAVAVVADVDELQAQLDALLTTQQALAKRRIIVEAAAMLLKDNGIKSKVIRHYIPIINKSINHYLSAMDFPILFQLNDEFAETIKSRHRDDFSYDSFSEGEKKRIDLALLLTWRAVARLKNSASTNLLILDEVFDSSLDANGTEEFLKIIAALESDTNIFVISHKTDQLIDKFANTITFEKSRGFSQIRP